MILLCLLRNIGLFLPVLLPTFAVDSAGPSQLSTSWDTQIAKSSSTSAAAATTVASASDVDAFVYFSIAAKTNETALFFNYIELSSTDNETNANGTSPSVDVKIEDGIDAPTPADDHTIEDDKFPSPFFQPSLKMPYVVREKTPSVAPAAALIRDNSRGELDLQTSSASFLVTMG